jgi:lipopolysaccharide transport system ATP-binding protein
LKDISFNIYHGENPGIIGRNGSGKSTLFQLLNGTLLLDKGTITRHKVRTSLLSLTVDFDQNVSARHNAILQGMLLSLSRAEMPGYMNDNIAFSELETCIDDSIKTYSAGMKQRLGFAAAMKNDTGVLLIDEILAVGDQIFRKKSRSVMEEKMKSGDTMVLVSHSPGDISQLCQRVIWLEEGSIRMEGTPDVVLPHYNKMGSRK